MAYAFGIKIKVRKLQGALIEATAGSHRVVIDMETGETVSTTVPIGSEIWRRMAKVARLYAV